MEYVQRLQRYSMKISLRIRRAMAALAAVFLAFSASAQTREVVINEVCADNNTAFNVDGDFPDYVELYNSNAISAVSIAGWRLTIDSSQLNNRLKTYTFPAGTSIGPRSFLLVICDGQTNLPLHTAFNLGKSGENLYLFGPSGVTPRDGVRFGFQVTDRPFGRVPDGAPNTHVLCFATPGEENRQAPLGSRTKLRINEWMPSADTNPDWFEIYNPETNAVSIGRLVFTDRAFYGAACTNKFTMTNSWLEAGGFLRFKADDKPNEGYDELDFKLSSGSDQIIMLLPDKTTIIHRIFWPDATGRQGQTGAAALFTSYGWLPDGNTNDLVVTFAPGRDTPEASNFLPIDEILINEVLAHTDPPLEDAIELYNATNIQVNIGGWWLSDNKDEYNKFRIPNDTRIDPNGYIVFYEFRGEPGGFNPNGSNAFPSFALSSSQGDEVYLFETDPVTGKLTGRRRGVDFPASPNGISYGRYVVSTNESDFVPLVTPTFGSDVKAGDPTNRLDEFRQGRGATNAGPAFGPVVISEIMYHPPDIGEGTNAVQNVLDEYVEIYNSSTETVYLYDTNVYPYPPFGMVYTNTWRLRGEADFNFPTNVSLGPGRSLIVINFGLTNTTQLSSFRNKYGIRPGVQIFGPYGGNLSDGGGAVELERPDAPQPPERDDRGFVPYLRVDRVRYNDESPWPTEPDGLRLDTNAPQSVGHALVRQYPDRYGSDAANWVAQVPTPGRQFISNSVSVVGNVATVSFHGLAGSSYTVQSRDALESGTWQKLEDKPAQTNSGPRQVQTVVAPGTKRFYRVLTPMQP
jgi:hypothetical protein